MEGASPAFVRRKSLFIAPTVIAALFVYGYALPYLSTGQERLGIFWPIRTWLYVHVAAGVLALLAGPVHLWGGRRYLPRSLYKILGGLYLGAVGASSVSAFYLAWNTGYGWVFGLGLGTMSAVWLVTTSVAAIAGFLNVPTQYREWMVRSYIVTFGFVVYQSLVEVFNLADLGTTVEQLSAASWACWSVPLLIGEGFLQGRKIFAAASRVRNARRVTSPSPQQATILSIKLGN